MTCVTHLEEHVLALVAHVGRADVADDVAAGAGVEQSGEQQDAEERGAVRVVVDFTQRAWGLASRVALCSRTGAPCLCSKATHR